MWPEVIHRQKEEERRDVAWPGMGNRLGQCSEMLLSGCLIVMEKHVEVFVPLILV